MKTAFLSNKIQYICISLLLSAMHINTISDFIRSTCLIISWFIVIYHDISWYVLIFLDKSWYITMYHDLSWFITIYHDISWFPTVLGEVNDECHCHTDFRPINHLIHYLQSTPLHVPQRRRRSSPCWAIAQHTCRAFGICAERFELGRCPRMLNSPNNVLIVR